MLLTLASHKPKSAMGKQPGEDSPDESEPIAVTVEAASAPADVVTDPTDTSVDPAAAEEPKDADGKPDELTVGYTFAAPFASCCLS